VSSNVIEASWQALEDSVVYALVHGAGVRSRAAAPGPPSSVDRSVDP